MCVREPFLLILPGARARALSHTPEYNARTLGVLTRYQTMEQQLHGPRRVAGIQRVGKLQSSEKGAEGAITGWVTLLGGEKTPRPSF